MSSINIITKETIAWAIVRYSVDGYSYIDTETISALPSISFDKAISVNKQCGQQWSKDNLMSNNPRQIKIQLI